MSRDRHDDPDRRPAAPPAAPGAAGDPAAPPAPAAPAAPARRADPVAAAVLALVAAAGCSGRARCWRCARSQVDGVTTLPADQVRETAGIDRGHAAAAGRRRRGARPGRPAAAGGLGRGHPRLAAHAWSSPSSSGSRRGRREAGRRRWSTPRACSSTRSPAPPAGVVPLDVPTPGRGDPADHGRPRRDRGPAQRRARQVARLAATSAEDISLTLTDGTLVRWGGPERLRPQGRRAGRAARAARRRRPRAGRHHRRQHAEGRRPPLRDPAPIAQLGRALRGRTRATGRPSTRRGPRRHARHATRSSPMSRVTRGAHRDLDPDMRRFRGGSSQLVVLM